MKKSKLKILFSTLALTTLVTIVPLTIVSCSSNKSTSNDNVNKPVEPSNPDIPSVTPPNKDEISSVGGEYNGLNVSNYLDVIKTLNLSSNTTSTICEELHSSFKFSKFKLFPVYIFKRSTSINPDASSLT